MEEVDRFQYILEAESTGFTDGLIASGGQVKEKNQDDLGFWLSNGGNNYRHILRVENRRRGRWKGRKTRALFSACEV